MHVKTHHEKNRLADVASNRAAPRLGAAQTCLAANRRWPLALVPLLALALVSGCNIDGLWTSGNAPDGAKTSSRRHAAAPVDLAIVGNDEVDLVESLIANRQRYHESLKRLRTFYETRGYATKRAWAEFELKGVRGVKPFRYLLDAEVPAASLSPIEHIAEADDLYQRATAMMKKGGHGVPALFRQDLMVEASELFRNLIVTYPRSDKIDDAAFFLGEIHKEYLPDQEAIALKWYERAWTWDPLTPHPARFQAAVVCDYRLHDRDRALELYQEVVDRETSIESNVRFAMRRIYELTMDTTDGARASATTP